MHCEYGSGNVVRLLLQLAHHGSRDGEVGRWGNATKDTLIQLGDEDKGVGSTTGASQDGPAVVVPVDDEAGVAKKAHDG